MRKLTKMLLIVPAITGLAISAFADRGIGKKSKSRLDMNISTANGFKNSISLNLKTGLKYTGSLLVQQQNTGSNILTNNLVTYQKGNTVYIVPSKQVVVMPETGKGYTGMKLIIKPH